MKEQSKRFVPLDILRGLTVAFMIIVNNPGKWGAQYPILMHAPWDGCTPTDLVYPFFLFCVGMAMAFSLAKFDGLNGKALWKILRRGALIFLLGIFLHAIPFNDWANLRYFGVLQRIACCYVAASILVLWLKSAKKIWIAIGVLLASYTAILLIFGEPGAQFTLEGNVSGKIDVALFGANHVYDGYGIPFDPEGPLGILSATCTALLGWLAGNMIRRRSDRDPASNVCAVLMLGLAGLLAGEVVSIWIPINKALWSASYVFLCAGWAMTVLGIIMFFTEVKGVVKPFQPAIIFGTNALVAFFLSGLLARGIGLTGWYPGSVFSTPFLSLVYSLLFMLLMWLINFFLYKKKIFIKL